MLVIDKQGMLLKSSCSFKVKASNNYLALRNMTGHYYLNGNWRIDFPQQIEMAGKNSKEPIFLIWIRILYHTPHVCAEDGISKNCFAVRNKLRLT